MSPLPTICNLYYGNANLNSCHYPQSCHNVSSSLFLQTSLANVYMTLIRTRAFTLFPSSSRPLPARDVAVQRKCFHWLDSRQFNPSMTIETENDEAVKVDFHYRLVLSVSCVYCVHVVWILKLSRIYARTGSRILPTPLSNSLPRDGAKFWLQANLVTQKQYLVEES